MELHLFGKNVEITPSIEQKVASKANKLKKYFQGKMKVEWNCEVIKDEHVSDVTVHGDGYHFHASASADSLYKTLDLIVNKLEKQLAKKQDQIKDKIHRGSNDDLNTIEPLKA